MLTDFVIHDIAPASEYTVWPAARCPGMPSADSVTLVTAAVV